MQSLLLMMKDMPVMEVDTSRGSYEVLNISLIPYQLKSPLWLQNIEVRDTYTAEDVWRLNQLSISKYELFISFLSSRVLPLDRKNSKKILTAFNLEQVQTREYRAKVAISCRAVSLQDNYWVKLKTDTVSWDDVNLRRNSLSTIVAQIALHGSSLSLQGKAHTPELTTQGAYAKCWKRLSDGLYMYKRGGHDSDDSHVEVEVSRILDKTNVSHVRYFDAKSQGKYCCRCKCITTEKISMLSAFDFIGYCGRNGYSADALMYKIDADSIYKMFIVDYLISNTDRHGMNWGFFYDCDTMQILGCHPLYDHNGAFDSKMTLDGEAYMFGNGKTLLECAKLGLSRTDFKFTKKVVKSDFYYPSHYQSFMEKCAVLGMR